jgi:hypothetical protein
MNYLFDPSGTALYYTTGGEPGAVFTYTHDDDNVLGIEQWQRSGEEWHFRDRVEDARTLPGGIDMVLDGDGVPVTFIKIGPKQDSYLDYGFLWLDEPEPRFERVQTIFHSNTVSVAVRPDGQPVALFSGLLDVDGRSGKVFAERDGAEWRMTEIALMNGRIALESLTYGVDGLPLAAVYDHDERALFMYGPGL